jgi:hypothetical protein
MNTDRSSIERNVARLASERTTLFTRSGSSFGLSVVDQNRLKVVERELDESFGALREIRAVRDATRFSREDPVVRRAIARNSESMSVKPRRTTS